MCCDLSAPSSRCKLNLYSIMNRKYFYNKSPLIGLAIFSFLILCIRLFFRGKMLILDESEQLVFAQKLLPGYASQPPLYTWILYFFFQLFGVKLFSIALLKSIFVFVCLYIFYLISRIHCKNSSLAWCAVFPGP